MVLGAERGAGRMDSGIKIVVLYREVYASDQQCGPVEATKSKFLRIYSPNRGRSAIPPLQTHLRCLVSVVGSVFGDGDLGKCGFLALEPVLTRQKEGRESKLPKVNQ